MSRREHLLRLFQLSLALVAVAVAVLTSRASDWEPAELTVLIGLLTVLTGLFPIAVREIKMSGVFLGIVLSMALLGPAPSVLIGLSAMLVQAAIRRMQTGHLICNLAVYSVFPLVGSLMVRAAQDAGWLTSSITIAGITFVVFAVTNVVNFLLIALDVRVTEGPSILASVRSIYAPVVPVELASGLLTSGLVFAYLEMGIAVIVLLAVVGLVFQYLVHLAFESMQRGEQLERRTQELASLQVGLLSTIVNTLSLRDKMTARHSAAVARYSRAIARELGLDERDQDVIHTAALLHDIGKFVFPDDILLADTQLTDEQYELVKTHPARGAELVEKIEGYGPVAEIVRSHHERVDGRGYPDGLIGDAIPLGSRIIAVCDTYDVMTARDSYRKPVSREVAVAELRRVAGAQLDAHVVDVFIRLLREHDIAFRHSDDADFFAELNFETRVRDYAAPREVSSRA